MKIKSLVLILFCLYSKIGHGQEKPEIINSSDFLKKGFEYYEAGKFEAALKEYQKVPSNDTNYYVSTVEQVLTYYKLEQYEEGIALGKRVINMTLYLSPELFIDMGCCYDNLEKYTEAIKIYDEGLRQFPKVNGLYFNKAFSLSKLERYGESFDCYKKSVQMNPFHPGSHYALGISAMNEGKTSLALLAFSTFILLNPQSPNANNALVSINDMTSSKYQENIKPRGNDITDGDDFSEIDMLIQNYVALNKKYKIPSKLNYNFLKQLYLLFEKLPDNPDNKGFWYQTYVPFYKQMLKDGKFDQYATYLLQASNNEVHKSIVEKNKPKIQSFVDWFKNAWDDHHREYQMEFNGKMQNVGVFRANAGFAISSMGILNAAKNDYLGYTEIFWENSKLKAVGKYKTEGKRDGEWIWYYNNGNIKTKAMYDNGTLLYYDSYSFLGIIETHIPYKNDKINGEAIIYNDQGAKIKLITLKDDVKNGKYEEYYTSGPLYATATNVDGKLDGTVKTYYIDGQIKSEVTYAAGEKNSLETSYYRTGKLMEKSTYAKGLLQGVSISYYDNGQVSDSVNYVNDKPFGKNIKYYKNGVVSEMADLDESGKLNGIWRKYETDGKICNELEYKKGEIIAYKYYDKNGNIIKQDKKNSGNFDYEAFYYNGIKRSEGKYGKEEKQGEWKFYDSNGNLQSISNYVEGEAQGECKIFFSNGNIKKILQYKDDKADGYYVEKFKNGNISLQGNYMKDEQEGRWIGYNNDKSFATDSYYIEGLANGNQKSYDLKGNISETELYYKGVLLNSINYDTVGNPIDSIIYTNASGKKVYHFYKDGPVRCEVNILYNHLNADYVYFFPNGKPSVKGQFVNGDKVGNWTWYYWNGNVSSTGNYDYDEATGKWEYYSEEGKLTRIINYEHGEKNGKEILYFENGKIEYESDLVDGLLEGTCLYYSPDGQLEHKRLYFHNQLISYTYFDADGKEKVVSIDNETAEIKIYFKSGKLARQFSLNNGIYQGEYKRFYPTGQLYEKLTYVDDDASGDDTYYYPNGQLKEKRTYVYGDADGTGYEYYADGKLKETTQYYLGDKYGKCYKYDKNGKIVAVLTYYDDDVVNITDK
ncbi:MAG: hypothetical protein WCQ95_12485 [Bacteroidota bacterium]